MRFSRLFGMIVIAVSVASCETPDLGETTVSGLLESEIGGEDSQLPPTTPGTLLGLYSGSEIGRLLTADDRRIAENVALGSLNSAPSGQVSSWSNPATGHSGTFVPTNLYRSLDDYKCRDFEQTVDINNKSRFTEAAACQAPNGAWHFVTTPARRSLTPDVRRR